MEETKNLKALNFVKIMLGLVFASVLLPSNLKSIAILLLGVSILLLVLQRKWTFNWPFFLINALYYILLILTISYSENLDYSIRKLTTMASAFVFPFIFALLNQSDAKQILKHLRTYLIIYIVSVFLFNVISFAYFFISNYTFQEMLIHFPTVVNVDMGKFSIHPIYLSMHCSVAVLFSFYVLKKPQSTIRTCAIWFMIITLLLFLLLYAKKGPLIALIIVFSLFVAFQQKKKLLKPYLLAVFGFILLIVIIPNTRKKFMELIEIGSVTEEKATSTNIRYTIYQTATELIAGSPAVGYGVGDYNDVLVEEYEEKGLSLLHQDEYNAHNQYLSFMLMGGIIVLLAFFLMLGTNLIFAIRYNNQLLILLLMFYGIVMMTENLLEREAGIIYFSFFISFFALFSREIKEKLATSKIN